MARNAPQKAPTRSEDSPSGTTTETTNPHDPDATLDASPEVEEGNDPAPARGPAQRGGAPGIVPEATRTIHPSPEEIVARAKEASAASPFAKDKLGAEPRRFRVLNEKRVMYAGSLSVVKTGKVYAEHEVDLGLLERQGVVFEQISGPPREET
jgi:hypothetical protein